MAAEIRPFPGDSNADARLQLLAKLDGHQDVINEAIILTDEDGVISISDDKTVRIWLKRDTGKYWPSVCHIMPAAASSMSFSDETKRLFVGMDTGLICEFSVCDDYNRINNTRTYSAHGARVTGVIFSLLTDWLLSVSKDKSFCWHCTNTGRRLGGFMLSSPCTSLQFDMQSKHAFIGDATGQITMLKIEETGYKPVTTLKGHSNMIRTLVWDADRQWLFSGGSDQVIICWDIGGRKGTAYELQGHNAKVTSLCYASQPKLLLSAGEDCSIVTWRMNAKRVETPEWAESDFCQRCSKPFFWNIKAMVDQKTIGLRQHHCRRCGKAVCDTCSSKRTEIPIMGYEFRVRVCNECANAVTDEDKESLANFYDSKHCVVHMDLDENKCHLLTSGADRVIKLWDISNILRGGD